MNGIIELLLLQTIALWDVDTIKNLQITLILVKGIQNENKLGQVVSKRIAHIAVDHAPSGSNHCPNPSLKYPINVKLIRPSMK